MNEEIKEICISRPGQILDYVDTKEHLVELYNYIINLQKYYNDNVNRYEELLVKYSNLQEENKRLKEDIKLLNSNKRYTPEQLVEMMSEELITDNKRLKHNEKVYKSRIDKAIEYNYELQERYCHSALFDDLVASKIYEITEKQLNILQGSDNNE